MTRQTKLNQSIFPDFPRGSPVVDKDGKFSANWHLALSSLFQALQKNFSNEGFIFPPLNEDDQNTILSIYTKLIGKTLQSTSPATPNISGKMIYGIPPLPTTMPAPKMFIIEFAKPEDATSTILSASWKTFTLV